MSRLVDVVSRKVVVVLLTVAGLIVVLAATRATWLTGTVEGVAGPVTAIAPGTEASSGLAAVALVGPAAAIAAVTAGRLGRPVALIVMALGALAVAGMSLRVVLQPHLVLGQVAARGSGGTGAFEAAAQVSAWPWVAVAGAALQLLAAVGGALGARRWSRLGARYETGGATGAEGDVPGSRGERVESDWDRISRGEEPTGTDRASDQTEGGGEPPER